MGKKTIFLLVTVPLLAVVSGVTRMERSAKLPLATALVTAVEADEQGKGPEYYRLPKGVTPLTYYLRMIPLMGGDGNMTFKGNITIGLLINSATDNITLHSKRLNVSEIRIFEVGPSKVEIPIENFSHDLDRDFLVVKSQFILQENKRYELQVVFVGELYGNNTGFYKSSYVDSAGKLQRQAATQFQADHARKAFPCFDEPHLKANFTISIARHREMKTLSNMNMKSLPVADQNLPENYVWDHHEESPKMSTYIMSFIVSNFSYVKANSQEFRVWTREEYIDDAKHSLEVGPKVLQVMQNITQIEYPLPKMDMVAIPDFNAGAMENWGLVTYKESVLLFNNESSSSADKQHTSIVVAHELAHQWFGDLVTPLWWTWTWLSEGFATYFSRVVMEKIEPSWRMMEQFVVDDLQPGFLSDSASTSAMNHIIKNPEDIIRSFDEISYKKGAAVIRMMAHFLSEATFSRGVHIYLQRRKYNSARDTDLFEAMDTQALIDRVLPENYTVSTIMTTWAAQAGHPLITVKRDYASGRVTLKQERFAMNRSNDANKTEKWWIPITYTSLNTRNFSDPKIMHWMKEWSASLQLENAPKENDWILLNLQQLGFYRVNYDEHNWKLLIDYLNSSDFRNIPPVNRAQLIDDALNLARAGYLNYSVALNLTSYLPRETDYIPLYSAKKGFSFLEARMSESREFKNFKAHIRHAMKSYYNTLRFEESPDDDHVTKVSRTYLLPWACKYNYDNCVSKATKLFQDWRENRIKRIPSDLKSVVYCFGVKEGGNEDWSFLWKAYQVSSVATEKELMLKSLACSRNSSKLSGLLEKTLDVVSGFRVHEVPIVFNSVCESPEGLEAAVPFLISTIKQMPKTLTPWDLKKRIAHVAGRISSKGLAEKMISFLDKIGDGPLAESAAAARKQISKNLAWTQQYGPEIESWLKKTYSSSSTAIKFTCSAIAVSLVFIQFLF